MALVARLFIAPIFVGGWLIDYIVVGDDWFTRLIGIVAVVAIWVGLAIAGVLGWVTAFRIYGVVRRVSSLGWAPPFIGVTTIVITLIVLPMAVADRGAAGLALVVGVSGFVALAIAALVWWNAAITRWASDRLDAMLEDDPELATRFRQHWWFKRISRKR